MRFAVHLIAVGCVVLLAAETARGDSRTIVRDPAAPSQGRSARAAEPDKSAQEERERVDFRDGDWGLAVTPFLFAPSTLGTVTLLDRSADLDLTIFDALADLQMVLAGDIAARWRDLVLNVNTWYINLGTSAFSNGEQARVGANFWITDTYAKYGFAFGKGKERLELLAGARIYSAALGLDIANGPRFDDDHNWVQPLVGLEYQSIWSDKWWFRAHADMAGFDPNDDFSSNLNAAFGRKFFKRSTLWFGYKMLWTQKTWGPGPPVLETGLDLFMHGVLAGWEWAF